MRYRFFKKHKPIYVPPQSPVQVKQNEEIVVETIKKEESVIVEREIEETGIHSIVEDEVKEKRPSKKNKHNKKIEEDMNNVDRLAAAEATIESMQPEVKVIKKDKGLIERTESSKIILTEDNRQVLND